MTAAPGGAITLLFADGATGLEALAAGLETSGGHEVKRAGGRLMSVFASASDAARFALAALEREPGVRIGVHTGEPVRGTDPSTGRPDYFGPAVNRAARIAEAAHPGQAVFSAPALDAARAALAGADVRPLGEHRMKGLERPEPLFQVLPAACAARVFPPLRTLTALPTNLPVQTTSFVGRERELRELEDRLASGARLVTLTGPAGVGKTRLAVRLGAELLGRYAGGCWFADLLESSGAGEGGAALAGVVAQALGIGVSGTSAADQVAAALAGRRPTLLILDTWDAARSGAGETLADWLRRAPGLQVLATGRAATGAAGETELRVDPFPVRSADRGGDAVRLFVERAREAKPGWMPRPGSEGDVAAICRELEGIPLAIELAAARVKIMQPATMRAKLGQKFQLLKSGRQDGASRQQTLAGAIEWGLEPLSPAERRVFLRLSVFRGGFLAEVAARVVGPEATPGRIEALRARSLLSARDYPWGRRYLLYRLIHEYAGREWEAASTPEERAALERRHADVALEYYAEWERRSRTSADSQSVERLEAGIENIAAVQERALARAAAEPSPAAAARELETAARAAEALSVPFGFRGSATDWLARIEPAVAAVERAPEASALMDPAVHAALLAGASEACRLSGDTARALDLAARAVASASRRPASPVLARALRIQAWLDAVAGRFSQALAALDRAVVIARDAGDLPLLAEALNARGIVLRRGGDAPAALDAFREAWQRARDAGFLSQEPALAANVATTLEMLGKADEAIAWYERAERGAEATGRQNAIAVNMANRANLLSQRGEHAEALAMFDRAEAQVRELGRPALAAACLAMRAAALGRAGRPAEGLEASRAAEALYASLRDRALMATLLAERALLLRTLGDPDGARAALDQAFASFESLGNRPALVQVAAAWAGLMLQAGRGPEARPRLRTALAGGAGTMPAVTFEALATLALCEEAAGDARAARAAAREAEDVLKVAADAPAFRGAAIAALRDGVARILAGTA